MHLIILWLGIMYLEAFTGLCTLWGIKLMANGSRLKHQLHWLTQAPPICFCQQVRELIIWIFLSFAGDYAIFMNEFHTDLPIGVEMHRSKTGGYYYTNCSDPNVFSDLDLQIDDHLYKIPAPLFIKCLEDTCFNRIRMKPEKFWVLGIVFLQMHY